MRWVVTENCVSLYWRNLRVAYARDVPEYNGQYDVIAVTFKWVIGCSDADFSRIATSLDLVPSLDEMRYPGKWNFRTLREAAVDLHAALTLRA